MTTRSMLEAKSTVTLMMTYRYTNSLTDYTPLFLWLADYTMLDSYGEGLLPFMQPPQAAGAALA
jgi:hypothetical protein